MRKIFSLALLSFVLAAPAYARQRIFDWTRANDESVQLDPTDYHTGRVYHPRARGRNIHVDIEAQQPLTVAMVWSDEWNNALQHPELMRQLEFRCLREHVVSYLQMPSSVGPADVPVIHDERTPNRAIVSGIGAVWGHNVGQCVSPNDLHIQYYSWNCTQNCIQPEFQWIRLVKQKYEVSSVPKIYSPLTPERDGQHLSVKIKASVPMTIAVLPSKAADSGLRQPVNATIGTRQ